LQYDKYIYIGKFYYKILFTQYCQSLNFLFPYKGIAKFITSQHRHKKYNYYNLTFLFIENYIYNIESDSLDYN